jgi:hypothetical protein
MNTKVFSVAVCRVYGTRKGYLRMYIIKAKTMVVRPWENITLCRVRIDT